MLRGFKMLGGHLLEALDCIFGQFLLYGFGICLALLLGLWVTLPFRCAGMSLDKKGSADDAPGIEYRQSAPESPPQEENGEELPDKLFDE